MLKLNRDFKGRLNFFKNEIKVLLFKYLYHNNKLTLKEKSYISYLFFKLKPFFFFSTKIKNKSILSKESRAVSRHFRISRWEFKKLASFGKLDNTRKSSW
jgi:ribosomal protein S14